MPTYNDPRDIPGLLVWYSACNEANYYADGDVVMMLHDLSGNGYDTNAVNPGLPGSGNGPFMRYTGGADGGYCLDAGPTTGKGWNIPQAAFLATSGTNGSQSMLALNAYGPTRGPLGAFSSDQYWPFSGPTHIYSDYCSTTRYQIDPVILLTGTWRKYQAQSKTNLWKLSLDGTLLHTSISNTYVNNPSSFMFGGGGCWLGAITNLGTGSGYKFGGYFLFDHFLTTDEQAFMDQWVDDFPCGGLPFIPDPPTEPTNGTADPGCDDATITWSSPVSGAVTGYHVRLDGGAETDVGLTFSHTFMGLDLGTSYDGEVQASGPDGESPWLTIPFTTLDVPVAPASVTLTATTSSVTATWPAVPDAEGYEVRIDGGPTINNGTGTSHLFTGLSPNSAHSVEVRAYNDCGTSDWTLSNEVTTFSQIVSSPCPCGDRWAIESCDIKTGRVRAIILATGAEWENALVGLGTGTLTIPSQKVALRDIFPDLTSIYISRITDDGSYDCQYAGYVEKVTGQATLDGGTMSVGLQPIEKYWWRRFLDTDRLYTNTEQTQIAASLTSYAVPDGIPLIGIAEPSIISRDRTYIGSERPFIGAQLDDLAQARFGIEWTVLHSRVNGFWTTTVVFQDRAGNDLNTIFRSDVHGADYGIDVDAANHATRIDGFGDDPASVRIISTAVDDGPYPRFDAAPSFGTVLDATNNQEQTDGYLRDYREPTATPSFTIVGEDPDPTGLRLGDTATFYIRQGAVTFNGPARVGTISSRIAEGEPWSRTLGLIPLGRASDTVLNQEA